ncbi:hypothetical protein [Streptosporangium roseum]|uniref:hypothetical protein n=1 Tax=Streptosporangium roseum TaxID=2001 RepID=UPI003319D387
MASVSSGPESERVRDHFLSWIASHGDREGRRGTRPAALLTDAFLTPEMRTWGRATPEHRLERRDGAIPGLVAAQGPKVTL